MADSLSPWLFSYLLNIAETYGAQISNLPLYEKKKKVQITEFLTFGSDDQATYIWALVSDKEYKIPLKFSKEAVAEFESSHNSRLTKQRGATVVIKNFRAIFSRLPSANGGKSSKSSYLAIECDSVTLLGGTGETTFGDPKVITNHPDMQLWSEGLIQPGGAGNVLKERKQKLELGGPGYPIEEGEQATPISPKKAHAPSATASNLPIRKSVLTMSLKTAKVTDLESYRARWQIVEKSTLYRHPPEQNDSNSYVPQPPEISAPEDISYLTTENQIHAEESRSQPIRSRSATPLASWEASSPQAPLSHESRVLSPRNTDTTASSLLPPTPAQRIKRSATTPDHTPSSPFPAGNESIVGMELDMSSSQAIHVRRQVPRKVPRPTSPQPRHTGRGPERVLVPNSDTSGTQSQSLNLSQSQSQHVVEAIVEPNSSRDPELAMDIDVNDLNHRRRPGGERSASEKLTRGKSRSPGIMHSSNYSRYETKRENWDGDGDGDRDGDEAAGREEEPEYPWISLRRLRAVIAKASAMRETRLGVMD